MIGLFPAEKVLGILLDENASYMPYGLLQSLLDQGDASPLTGAVLLTAVTAGSAWSPGHARAPRRDLSAQTLSRSTNRGRSRRRP